VRYAGQGAEEPAAAAIDHEWGPGAGRCYGSLISPGMEKHREEESS
jgi:hypothetical protein